jgi:aspartate/methionine/tyrosine aminotransferase
MPELSQLVTSLKPSVFASLNEKMKQLKHPPISLHIGDTYVRPPAEACWENLPLDSAHHYRYSHPFGVPALLEEVAQKLRSRNAIEASPEWLQITCGATAALHSALQTLIEPGQKVLILAPYWPLFGGMARCQGVIPVEVDCSARDNLRELLDSQSMQGVRGLYFGNPNNPDGYLYSRAELEVIAEFAQRHDLWIFSDECYEHYTYDGRSHLSLASLPEMAERTVSVFSFSKSYAMAGHRLGYACAHPKVMSHLRRVANHTVYNVSSSIQQAGLEVLKQGEAFCAGLLPNYEAARNLMCQSLKVAKPMGGAYCFVDLGTPERAWQFLESAIEQGVALAPGAAFGEAYAHCVRICFTCVPKPQLEEACQILAGLIEKGRMPLHKGPQHE